MLLENKTKKFNWKKWSSLIFILKIGFLKLLKDKTNKFNLKITKKFDVSKKPLILRFLKIHNESKNKKGRAVQCL